MTKPAGNGLLNAGSWGVGDRQKVEPWVTFVRSSRARPLAEPAVPNTNPLVHQDLREAAVAVTDWRAHRRVAVALRLPCFIQALSAPPRRNGQDCGRSTAMTFPGRAVGMERHDAIV